jgi:regulator of sigma E protease
VASGPAGRIIAEMSPGAALEKYLDTHDEILSIDGQSVSVLTWREVASRSHQENLELEVRRLDGETQRMVIPRRELLASIARQEVRWAAHNARVAALREESPLLRAGLQRDDVLLQVGKTPVYDPDKIRELVGAETTAEGGAAISCIVSRRGERVRLELPRAALASADGIEWQSFPPLAAVDPEGPAGKAGITTGSRIVRLGDKPIRSFEDLLEARKPLTAGQQVEVAWLDPSGAERTAAMTAGGPEYESDLGIDLRTPEVVVREGVLRSFVLGIERSVIVVKQVFLTLRSLIRGDVEAKNLSGPVGITHLFTKMAEMGWVKLLFWIAVVSVNLGVLNLLPFPILDGGHLFFLVIEKLKGSPVSFAVQEWATRFAFLAIIALALFVTYYDVGRLF